MAVARCQYDVGTLAKILKSSGRTVEFCIHPVAGRLPGHMNVLLAEADVDYSIVKEMSEVNPHLADVDLVLVIGANDIVNPDAEDNEHSPIAGMPVCQVWRAKRTVVFKRGSGKGYSDIENPLFFKENTRMYYGSADKSIKEILNGVTANNQDFQSKEDSGSITEDSGESEECETAQYETYATIGVPRENHPERRVAVTPSMVKQFNKRGFGLRIETGAGDSADFTDNDYKAKGAAIVSTIEAWNSEIILKIRSPTDSETQNLASTKLLVCYLAPGMNENRLSALAGKYPELTCIAMDCVPRTTKAQKLDSLSSMANLGGYRAVIEGFQYFKKCPKPIITAAGKLPPTEVLVVGAGVAGLSAIGYCKGLGCIVRAIDSRPAAKQDAESMGALFLEVKTQEDGTGTGGYAREMSEEFQRAQKELMLKTAKRSDIIITTALIPGKPAPKLVTDDVLEVMRSGSVVVDMAAEMGGNCTRTVTGQVVVTENRVTIVGFTDLVSRMAPQASELYANNMWNLLDEMGGGKDFKVDMDHEIIKYIVVVHKGRFCWTQPVALPPTAGKQEPQHPLILEPKEKPPGFCHRIQWLLTSGVLAGLFVGLGYATYTSFMDLFLVFILSIFIGNMVIWNVAPSLHTPLMSVTNAISGIIIIGAMLTLESNGGYLDSGSATGLVAVFFASINIWGGFIVTYRMLRMFKSSS